MKTLVKIGVVAATLASTASAVFGTVSDSDVHRLTGTVSAVRFSQLAPGMMFEVVGPTGTVTPVCRYSNAAEGLRREHPRHDVYYNSLGRNFPVPTLIGSFVKLDNWKLQVRLEWTAYAEGLDVGFRGKIDELCETAAQRAFDRQNVVCVVDSVLREPGGNEIVAVRFKPYGFTPSGADRFPLCPLGAEADLFWTIRRAFISVAAAQDPVNPTRGITVEQLAHAG